MKNRRKFLTGVISASALAIAGCSTEDTDTEENEDESTPEQNSASGYQMRVSYSGDWSGSISAGDSSRTVDGSGTETIDIDGDPNIISANAQKQDDSSSELTIQILEDGEVIEQGSTTASYGVAQITHSDY